MPFQAFDFNSSGCNTPTATRVKLVVLRLPLQPDSRQAEDVATALMQASGSGHLELVQLLCEAGADKDKEDGNAFTALIHAS